MTPMRRGKHTHGHTSGVRSTARDVACENEDCDEAFRAKANTPTQQRAAMKRMLTAGWDFDHGWLCPKHAARAAKGTT